MEPSEKDIFNLQCKIDKLNSEKEINLNEIFRTKYKLVDYELITTNTEVRAAEKLALSNKHNQNNKPYSP